ncbi:MAG TPA: ELWxxDGT repeat protein, partial [Thermoanaerobaculia bacterium]
DGLHGSEPWVSDGTPGETELLADLNPGDGWAFEIFFAPLLAGTLGGQAFFFAFDPDAGWELRATGGEPGDVALVQDIDDQQSAIPAPAFFRWTETADVSGTLFYLASDPDHGAELWASDGTEAGTRLVRDLQPGPSGGFPSELAALGDLLLFEGPGDGTDRWLWVSDGDESGTVPITGAAAQPLDPSPLARFGDRVYFGAEGAGGGRTLWVSDGTDAGTHPFPEESPLPAPWGRALPVAGDRLFVPAASELWATAGNAATSEKLADVEAWDLAPAGPLLFFSGDDGSTGLELWVSDGTPSGTRRVLDLVPGPEGAVLPRAGFGLPLPDGPGVAGVTSPPSAFFIADDGAHGRELWWSDGTEAGTRLLGDLRPGPLGSEPRYLTVVGSVAHFVADDGVHGAELWRSDGTEAGTFLLADLEPGPGSSVPDSLTAVYGELFFSAWRAEDGRELWRSDGTAAGTVRLQDLNPGAGSASPGYFTLSGDRLYFTASDGERGFELWSLQAAAPRLVGTKELAGGDLRAGGRVVYAVTLHNPGSFGLDDNPGDELVDELPAGLTAVSVQADSGAATVDPDGRTVRWNGGVPAGGTVTITIEAAIALDAAGTLVANQAQLAYDGDGSGDNETLASTDDPAAAGPADPTEFVAAQADVLQIPTLGPLSLALLTLLLAAAGLLLVRLE